MTISITTNKTGPTAGDGVVTSFNYNFRIDDEDDLVVIHTDAAGVEATFTIAADYTVAGVGAEAGGAITYPVSGTPLPATETLTLKRVLSLTQSTNLRNQGGYFPEVQETALDRLLMQIQQLDEADGRAITLSPTTDTALFSPVMPGTLTANFVLAVNSSGTGLALVKATPSGVVISTFAATFLDDTTAAAARTALEIDGSSGKIVAGDLATGAVNADNVAAASAVMGPPGTTAQSGTAHTPDINDANTMIRYTNAAAVTVTIPPNADVAYAVDDEIYFGQETAAGQVTLVPGTGVTLNTPESLKTRTQWSVIGIKKTATNTWIVFGDVEAA